MKILIPASKTRIIKRSIALITAVLFLFSGITVPDQASANTGTSPVSEINISRAFHLEIPEKWGNVETLVTGAPGAPAIIHIQEAHGVYEIQKKIEGILHHLKDRYHVKVLLLEGDAFKLKPELIRFFPNDKKGTREIAETLAKKGLVTGPELFFLEDKDTEAHGIENLKSYNENGAAFVRVLKEKAKTESFVQSMNLQIERLTSPYLNKNLRTFLDRLDKYEAGQIPFDVWLDELKTDAGKYLEKDLTSPWLQTEWPMLLRIFTLQRFEKEIDLPAFKKEREGFLKILRSKVEGGRSKQNRSFVDLRPSSFDLNARISELLNAPLSHQKLADPETGLLFEQMVSTLPKDFDYAAYPNMNRFIGHLILQSELKGDKLMEEIEKLTDLISQKLATNEKEQTIVGLLKDLRLLKRLFRLELTAGDYEKISRGGRLKVEGRRKKEKGEVKNNAESNRKFESVAGEYETGEKSLSHDSRVSERGTIWADKPVTARGGFDSGQHRRGQGEVSQERVRSVPLYSSRVQLRTNDITTGRRNAGILQPETNPGASPEYQRDYRHDQWPNPVNSLNASSSTRHLLPSSLIKQFESLNSDHLVRNSEFLHLDEIDKLFHDALEFYRGAKERDGWMLENIEKFLGGRQKVSGGRKAEDGGRRKVEGNKTLLPESGILNPASLSHHSLSTTHDSPNAIVVITGGFHSGPFQEYFKKKNYNYALITPKMTESSDTESYVKNMIESFKENKIAAPATHRLPDLISSGAKVSAYNIDPGFVSREVLSALGSKAETTSWYRAFFGKMKGEEGTKKIGGSSKVEGGSEKDKGRSSKVDGGKLRNQGQRRPTEGGSKTVFPSTLELPPPDLFLQHSTGGIRSENRITRVLEGPDGPITINLSPAAAEFIERLDPSEPISEAINVKIRRFDTNLNRVNWKGGVEGDDIFNTWDFFSTSADGNTDRADYGWVLQHLSGKEIDSLMAAKLAAVIKEYSPSNYSFQNFVPGSESLPVLRPLLNQSDFLEAAWYWTIRLLLTLNQLEKQKPDSEADESSRQRWDLHHNLVLRVSEKWLGAFIHETQNEGIGGKNAGSSLRDKMIGIGEDYPALAEEVRMFLNMVQNMGRRSEFDDAISSNLKDALSDQAAGTSAAKEFLRSFRPRSSETIAKEKKYQAALLAALAKVSEIVTPRTEEQIKAWRKPLDWFLEEARTKQVLVFETNAAAFESDSKGTSKIPGEYDFLLASLEALAKQGVKNWVWTDITESFLMKLDSVWGESAPPPNQLADTLEKYLRAKSETQFREFFAFPSKEESAQVTRQISFWQQMHSLIQEYHINFIFDSSPSMRDDSYKSTDDSRAAWVGNFNKNNPQTVILQGGESSTEDHEALLKNLSPLSSVTREKTLLLSLRKGLRDYNLRRFRLGKVLLHGAYRRSRDPEWRPGDFETVMIPIKDNTRLRSEIQAIEGLGADNSQFAMLEITYGDQDYWLIGMPDDDNDKTSSQEDADVDDSLDDDWQGGAGDTFEDSGVGAGSSSRDRSESREKLARGPKVEGGGESVSSSAFELEPSTVVITTSDSPYAPPETMPPSKPIDWFWGLIGGFSLITFLNYTLGNTTEPFTSIFTDVSLGVAGALSIMTRRLAAQVKAKKISKNLIWFSLAITVMMAVFTVRFLSGVPYYSENLELIRKGDFLDRLLAGERTTRLFIGSHAFYNGVLMLSSLAASMAFLVLGKELKSMAAQEREKEKQVKEIGHPEIFKTRSETRSNQLWPVEGFDIKKAEKIAEGNYRFIEVPVQNPGATPFLGFGYKPAGAKLKAGSLKVVVAIDKSGNLSYPGILYEWEHDAKQDPDGEYWTKPAFYYFEGRTLEQMLLPAASDDEDDEEDDAGFEPGVPESYRKVLIKRDLRWQHQGENGVENYFHSHTSYAIEGLVQRTQIAGQPYIPLAAQSVDDLPTHFSVITLLRAESRKITNLNFEDLKKAFGDAGMKTSKQTAATKALRGYLKAKPQASSADLEIVLRGREYFGDASEKIKMFLDAFEFSVEVERPKAPKPKTVSADVHLRRKGEFALLDIGTYQYKFKLADLANIGDARNLDGINFEEINGFENSPKIVRHQETPAYYNALVFAVNSTYTTLKQMGKLDAGGALPEETPAISGRVSYSDNLIKIQYGTHVIELYPQTQNYKWAKLDDDKHATTGRLRRLDRRFAFIFNISLLWPLVFEPGITADERDSRMGAINQPISESMRLVLTRYRPRSDRKTPDDDAALIERIAKAFIEKVPQTNGFDILGFYLDSSYSRKDLVLPIIQEFALPLTAADLQTKPRARAIVGGVSARVDAILSGRSEVREKLAESANAKEGRSLKMKGGSKSKTAFPSTFDLPPSTLVSQPSAFALTTLADEMTGYLVLYQIQQENPELFGQIFQVLAKKHGAVFGETGREALSPKIRAFLNSEAGSAIRALFLPAQVMEKPQRFVLIDSLKDAEPIDAENYAKELAVPVLRSILDTNGYEVVVAVKMEAEAEALHRSVENYVETKLHLKLNQKRFRAIVIKSDDIASALRSSGIFDNKTQVTIAGDGESGGDLDKALSALPESANVLRLLDNAHLSTAEVALMSGVLLSEKTIQTLQGVQFTRDHQDGRFSELLTAVQALAAVLQAA